jgi:hypothetical protein
MIPIHRQVLRKAVMATHGASTEAALHDIEEVVEQIIRHVEVLAAKPWKELAQERQERIIELVKQQMQTREPVS